MRTFRRPMFRKGGNVGDGIMTGIVDRSMHAEDPFVGETDQFPRLNTTPRAFKPMEYENINIDELVGTPKTQAEYIEELKAGAGEYGGMDPLTSFLLTAGPNVAGATSFSDAVNRLKPATQQLIKGADAKAKYNRDLRMAATKLAIGAEEKSEDKRFKLNLQDMDQENQVKYLNDERAYNALTEEDKRDFQLQVADRARAYEKLDKEAQREYEEKLISEGRAFELEQIKRKEDFEMDKMDKQQKFQKDLYDQQQEEAKKYTEKDFIEVYEGDTLQASNRAKFENSKLKTVFIEKFGSQFDGFLNGPNDPQESTMIKKGSNKKVGKVYYDVNTGQAKIYNKKTDGTYGFQVIDINTYVKPDAPVDDKNKKTSVFDAEEIFGGSGSTPVDEKIRDLVSKNKEDIKKGTDKITGPFR